MSEDIVGADRIAVALDCETTSGNMSLIRQLSGHAQWFKVGMRQYYRSSEPIIDAIRQAGAKLFLDLKLHDIPQTVAGAAESLSSLSPELVTVHAGGGQAMIEAAVEGFARGSTETGVLGVTVLTSLDASDLEVFGGEADVAGMVERLSDMVRQAGGKGVVCSPHEVAKLSARWPAGEFVTPGIRPKSLVSDDQKRVSTPSQAIVDGSSLLVVGRPIRQADDPVAAFEQIATVRLSG